MALTTTKRPFEAPWTASCETSRPTRRTPAPSASEAPPNLVTVRELRPPVIARGSARRVSYRAAMTAIDRDALIYDWNRAGAAASSPAGRIQFDDETLRDGLQSPSARDPEI